MERGRRGCNALSVASFPTPAFDHYWAMWNEPDIERARHHLDLAVAPDGVIWMNWGDRDKSAPKPGEWWKLENQDGIVKGFKEKRKVSKLRKKLSV